MKPKPVKRKLIETLSQKEAAILYYDWQYRARPKQLEPGGDWNIWLIMAGRGFGKTRTGSEWIRSRVESGKYGRVGLIGATAADVRDVMVEGESGIMAISPPWFRPNYEPSKRRLTWPNGAVATTFSAEEPDRLRGPQHNLLWADELAAWRYPDAWHMAMLGLRVGHKPQAIVTTTPKPVKLLTDMVKSANCVVVSGTTFENIDNLAPSFIDEILGRYEGSRIGQQEIYAQLLTEYPGALWTRNMIEQSREKELPAMSRVVVAVDPAVTSGPEASETGIIVVGYGINGHIYVIADYSCHKKPDGWAREVVKAYHQHQADRVIAEVNNGGDLVETVVRLVDPEISYKSVHASRGKRARAEPVAALYEQGRIRHVGVFEALEDQMVMFTPDSTLSPDRIDALVWGVSELMFREREHLVTYSERVSISAY